MKIVIALCLLAAPLWANDAETLDYVLRNRGMHLGGNSEGANESRMPDGSRVVVTQRRGTPQDLEQTRATIQRLSDEGKFVKIKAMGIRDNQLVIVMENMRFGADGRAALASGNGANLRALRELPAAERTAVRDRMLELLSTHPDGHPLNVMWRRVETKSGPKVEVRLVDPFIRPTTQGERVDGALRFNGFPEPMKRNAVVWQYNTEKQRDFFNEQLGLPQTGTGGTQAGPGRSATAASGGQSEGHADNFRKQRDRQARRVGSADLGPGQQLSQSASTVGNVGVVAAAAAAAAAQVVDFDNRYRESAVDSLNDAELDRWKSRSIVRFGFEAASSGSNPFHANERAIANLKRIAEGGADGNLQPKPSEVFARAIGKDAFLRKLAEYETVKSNPRDLPVEEYEKILHPKQRELAGEARRFLRAYYLAERGGEWPWRRIDWKSDSRTALPGTFFYNAETDRILHSTVALRDPTAGMAAMKRYLKDQLGASLQFRVFPSGQWYAVDDLPYPAPRVAEDRGRRAPAPEQRVHQ